MKSSLRSAKDILKKIVAIILIPFVIIFLIFWAALMLLMCLIYIILTKLYGNRKFPNIFSFLYDDDYDNYSYYNYQHQTDYKEDACESED